MRMSEKVRVAADILSSIAVIGAVIALGWTLYGKGAAIGAPSQIEAVDNLQIEAPRRANVVGAGRITIIEFSDFQCPYCARHAKETFPVIKRYLLSTGDVSYIALHFPLEDAHPRALQASEATEVRWCAGTILGNA